VIDAINAAELRSSQSDSYERGPIAYAVSMCAVVIERKRDGSLYKQTTYRPSGREIQTTIKHRRINKVAVFSLISRTISRPRSARKHSIIREPVHRSQQAKDCRNYIQEYRNLLTRYTQKIKRKNSRNFVGSCTKCVNARTNRYR